MTANGAAIATGGDSRDKLYLAVSEISYGFGDVRSGRRNNIFTALQVVISA